MGALQWLGNFWAENSNSILISLGVGLVFFVLGPLGLWFSGRKVKRERLAKAQVMLVDLVESMLVNQEKVTAETLTPLMQAVGREVEVALADHYDLELLIQDVMLRFQRSKHLDADQKAEYVENLVALADQVRAGRKRVSQDDIPRRYQAILADLEDAVGQGDEKEARERLSELRKRLIGSTPADSLLELFGGPYVRMYRRNPRQFVVTLIVGSTVYAVFIVWFILR